jgi:hypothetical protein
MGNLIQIDIPGLGTVTFRSYLTMGQARMAYDRVSVVEETERAEIFTNFVISCMLIDPQKAPEEVAAFSPETLDSAVQSIVDILELRDEFEQVDESRSVQERFYTAYQAQTQIISKQMLDTLASSVQSMKLVDQMSIQLEDKHLLDDFSAAVKKMDALNLKVSVPDLSMLKLSGNLNSEISSIARESLKSFSEIGKLAGLEDKQLKEAIQSLKMASDSSILKLAQDISKYKLPEPYWTDAMLVSGLDSQIIHSPRYVLPPVQDIIETVSPEETSRRRLTQAYDIISHLEPSLRDFIEAELRTVYGDDWWVKGVPNQIRIDCEDRKSKKEKSFENTYHPIYYAYVNDYLVIIERRDNWKNIFRGIFGDQNQLKASFAWVSQSRDPVAHNRPITDDDLLMLTAGAKWIQVRIERQIKRGSTP